MCVCMCVFICTTILPNDMQLINLLYLAMEFSHANYGAIASLFVFSYYLLMWIIRSTNPKTGVHKAPPAASGAWPFTGHLHLMNGGSSAGLPHINLANLADKHGPVFTIRLGVHRVVVVSTLELAKELFTTNDVAVSSRPITRAANHLGYDFAMLGFSSYGPYWRELRKVISLQLLSARRLELQRNVRVSETVQSVNELYKLWEGKRDGSGRVLVDMKRWFGDLNLNVVLMMVVGKRFSGEDDAEETRRCRAVMRDFFELMGMFVPADVLPYLGWLDIGGHEKRMKETGKEMDKIVGEWLVEHRRKKYSGEDNKAEDFMDVMLSAVQAVNFQGQYDVDTIIKALCGNLIAGASDSITVVLVWALSLLLNNRQALKKAQEELDQHVGRERRVNESDIKNLVYLQAITKETLRLYAPAPLAGARRFTEDCTVGGYHVPKGTWLLVNLWKLHRDPRVWPHDPLEFRPERFLSRHKDVDVKGQDFELIPFSAGRRICPGVNFGLRMLHLVLANLLQAFELSTVSDEKVDMSESAGVTNLKATPLDVLVAPRLPPSLYYEAI